MKKLILILLLLTIAGIGLKKVYEVGSAPDEEWFHRKRMSVGYP